MPAHDVEAIVDALVQGDARETRRMLQEAADERGSLEAAYHDVLHPALTRVGDLWAAGNITVADEHRATQQVRDFLGQLKHAHEPRRAPDASWRAVVACAQGESHDVGARMFADALDHRGWRVHYLGADVPVRDLAEFVARHRPHAVVITATTAPRLHAVADAVAAVRAAAPDPMPVVAVGGRPFTASPALATRVGADVGTTTIPDGVRALESAVKARAGS